MIERRGFLRTLGLSLLAVPLGAEAQSAGKVPRIGILRSGSAPDPFVEAFRQGLVINLKTAKALGVTIPPSVLARADEVIQ